MFYTFFQLAKKRGGNCLLLPPRSYGTATSTLSAAAAAGVRGGTLTLTVDSVFVCNICC